MTHSKTFHDAIPPLPYTFRQGLYLITIKRISHDDHAWYIHDMAVTRQGIPLPIPPEWWPLAWVDFVPGEKVLDQIHRLVSEEMRKLWDIM